MLQGPKVLSMPWWIATHFVGSLNPGATHRLPSSSFSGLYLGPYKVIPKRSYEGAYGYSGGMTLLSVLGWRP